MSLQDDLCKCFRAAGIPKGMTLELTNQISTWYRSSGSQWTVDRLKGYRQWYETYLGGDPRPPAWFRHGDDGMPLGIWKAVFKFRNPARALAVFSASTLFQSKDLTSTQRDKFISGLGGNGQVEELGEADLEALQKVGNLLSRQARCEGNRKKGGYRGPEALGLEVPPTSRDVTATSIPVGRHTLRVSSQQEREEVLLDSWEALPLPSAEYLQREGKQAWIPSGNQPPAGVDLSTFYMPWAREPKTGEEVLVQPTNLVGRIGLIQEPELKLRSVANPNRVSQALTLPLALTWDSSLSRFQTDCTYNQDAGIRWVQQKLAQGVTLAGSDMSSATDLLDLSSCLLMAAVATISDWLPRRADRVGNLSVYRRGPKMGYLEWVGHPDKVVHGRYKEPIGKEVVRKYNSAVEHFIALSRGVWCTPEDSELGDVRWLQGQPLGLYPSFRLLAIANNTLGSMAAVLSGLDPNDSFRVIGDDIIMDQAMEQEYVRLVHTLGGQINSSKTITSSRVAEFAGRIILPDRVLLKRIKYAEPSDDSFMQIISDLGPQAISLLRPRQREVWERFRYIPGIVLEGPWMKDSFGEPLVQRLSWALTRTDLFQQDLEADPETTTVESDYLAAALRGTSDRAVSPSELAKLALPDFRSNSTTDYQSVGDVSVPKEPRPSGDPRRAHGLSTLRRLERARLKETYEEYISQPEPTPTPGGTDGAETSSITAEAPWMPEHLNGDDLRDRGRSKRVSTDHVSESQPEEVDPALLFPNGKQDSEPDLGSGIDPQFPSQV